MDVVEPLPQVTHARSCLPLGLIEMHKERLALSKQLGHYIEGLKYCFDNDYMMPGMILAYSFLDILGWLIAEHDSNSANKNFKKYVNDYLLPESKLFCTSEDLWGGRCALLHTYTAESSDYKKGKARIILPVFGVLTANELNRVVEEEDRRSDYVVVHVKDLENAIRSSVQRLIKAMTEDIYLCLRVLRKSERFYRQATFRKERA